MINKFQKFQKPGRVRTVDGSVISPQNGGLRFVLSVNNLVGNPDGNPLLPLFDKKWPRVRSESRGWYGNKDRNYVLGGFHTLAVQADVWICMLLVQDENLKCHTDALKTSLDKVRKLAVEEHADIHVSKLLVDSIPELNDLLTSTFVDNGISVTFYTEQPAKE